MKTKKSLIFPNVGLDSIKFGMYIEDIVNILGPPEEMENPNEEGDIIFSYENIGINILAFDKDENYRLVEIELNKKSNAILWDKKIFEQKFEKIKTLSAKMGYLLEFEDSVKDSDTGEVFEESFKIDPLYISFYFNELKILEEISIGAPFNEDDEIEWPA